MTANDEDQLVKRLARVFESQSGVVRMDIGDDAAVQRIGRALVASSVDACVEHVHFEREWLSLTELGRKSMHAAVSDLAAVGAMFEFALSHVSFPASADDADIVSVARGQARAADELGGRVTGGNLSRSSHWSIVTTVFGRAVQPLTRAGARPGNEVWLIGEVGLARAGLLLFQSGAASRGRAATRCRKQWRCPHARLAESVQLRGVASSCIDLSDGLVRDAPRLADSSGVRLELDARLLRESLDPALTWAARYLDTSALQLAVTGGEDYALLATGPSARRPPCARPIGRVTRGDGAWLRLSDSDCERLTGGWDHRAAD